MEPKEDSGARGPSAIEEVALPIEDVQLLRLKTRTGDPVVVRCEFVDEETLLRVTEGLPGIAPEMGAASDAEKAERRVRTVRQLMAYARPIIEAGTVLRREDGSEVRPAFYFESDPGTGALPGRFLSAADRSLLFATIMRLSGYVGGPASSFRVDGGERGGGGHGSRSLDSGPGDGDATAPTARVPGSGPSLPAGGGERSAPDVEEVESARPASA